MRKYTTSYRYIKAAVKVPVIESTYRPPRPAHWKKLISPALITLGSLLIANVSWPILSSQLIHAPKLQRTQFISPARQPIVTGLQPAIIEQVTAREPEVLGMDLDYTQVDNWFPTAVTAFNDENEGKTYTIEIPKLDIQNAEVLIGGEDLDEHLIHYPGTAEPGQLGAPVIFGHSVLRQFYNPSENNPDRYTSMFTKIMDLKNGDRIHIDYEGVKYTYEVKDKLIVDPEDIFILEQRYNNRELKLITCYPSGTYLERGVVIAQLVDLE